MTNKINSGQKVSGFSLEDIGSIMGEAFAHAIQSNFAVNQIAPPHAQHNHMNNVDFEAREREGLYGKGHFGHCFGHAAFPELMERHRRLTASMEKVTQDMNGPRGRLVGAPPNLQQTQQNRLGEAQKQLTELESLISQLYGAGGLTFAKIQSLPGYAGWPNSKLPQE